MQVRGLPDIRMIDPEIRLLDLGDLDLSKGERKVFDFVVRKNREGTMPISIEIESDYEERMGEKFGFYAFRKLKAMGRNIIRSYSVPLVARTYGYKNSGKRFKYDMPQSLKFVEMYLEKYPVMGRRGTGTNILKKNLSPTGIYPRFYLAAVKENNIPVFSSIFYFSDKNQ